MMDFLCILQDPFIGYACIFRMHFGIHVLEIEKHEVYITQDFFCRCPACIPAGVQCRVKSGIPAFFQEAGREFRLRQRFSAAQRDSTTRFLIKQ